MLRIALLYGGTSSEREISIRSGKAIQAALERIGHRVTPVDYGQGSIDLLDQDRPDFVFIALHGGEGEDGTVQRQLEEIGLPFSGAGPVASRLCMDKELSKAEFLAHRVPTPPHETAQESDAAYRLRRMARRIGWPIAVKPIDQGSSIGVSIVRGPEGIEAALASAFQYGPRVLFERAIVGRELTVGIVGNRALPVCEVIAADGFFDYDAKYNKAAGTRYLVNPKLPDAVTKMAQHHARRAHLALRCHGYSRVDLMLDENNELWVLEVNTLPGMTEMSLLPKAAAAEGISFDELVQELIDVSREPRPAISGRSTRVMAA